jgi:hypothetical protein
MGISNILIKSFRGAGAAVKQEYQGMPQPSSAEQVEALAIQ